MDYLTVTAEDLEGIRRRKLREIELEHAGLTLELRLAAIAGIANEATALAQRYADLLTVEHAVLVADLGLQPRPITVTGNDEEFPDPPAEDGECLAS